MPAFWAFFHIVIYNMATIKAFCHLNVESQVLAAIVSRIFQYLLVLLSRQVLFKIQMGGCTTIKKISNIVFAMQLNLVKNGDIRVIWLEYV